MTCRRCFALIPGANQSETANREALHLFRIHVMTGRKHGPE
jgi:hypothetical protein